MLEKHNEAKGQRVFLKHQVVQKRMLPIMIPCLSLLFVDAFMAPVFLNPRFIVAELYCPDLKTSFPSSQTNIPGSKLAFLVANYSIEPQLMFRSSQTNVPEPQTRVPEPQTSVPSSQTNVPGAQTNVPELEPSDPQPQTRVPLVSMSARRCSASCPWDPLLNIPIDQKPLILEA